MARFGGICCGLLAFVVMTTEQAAAQVKLELTFAPNETVRQQLIQTTKIDVTPPGKKDVYTTQIDQSWLLESTAGETEKDGSVVIRQHFSQIGMTIQLPPPISRRFSVDTAQPVKSEDPTEQNMQEAVSKVVGLDWNITFQKNGVIRKVALSDELSDLLVDNPQVGPLMDTFTDSGLRKLSEQSTVTFPLKPVSKGDQWEQTVTSEFPEGKLSTQRICTFDGTVEDGLLKISVKLNAKYESVKAARQPMELTSNSGSGEVYFDPQAGRVVRSKFQQTMVLKSGTPEQPALQKIHLTTVLHPAEERAPVKKSASPDGAK